MRQTTYEELQNYKDELGDNDFELYVREVPARPGYLKSLALNLNQFTRAVLRKLESITTFLSQQDRIN